MECWSCGGLERSRHLQVEPCFQISSTASQNSCYFAFSSTKPFFLFFCYHLHNNTNTREAKTVRGVHENSHLLKLLGSQLENMTPIRKHFSSFTSWNQAIFSSQTNMRVVISGVIL
ncbi:hypothetical protein V8G54_022965 [Vigna mungo]|uniref:Uncharacterized protein n=1 Tax=Vigna mungo TaxID=3915 RepID=A0AAQ3N3D2_VIGMU